MWQGAHATLNDIVIRGVYRPVNTLPLVIINLRLTDIGDGGDPAVMVYHYLQSWFPKDSNQVLDYLEINFSFNPSRPSHVSAHKRKMNGYVQRIVRYV